MEAGGVEFTNGDVPGVRLRRRADLPRLPNIRITTERG